MVAHCYGFCHDIEGGERLARRIVACLNACKDMNDEQLIDAIVINHVRENGETSVKDDRMISYVAPIFGNKNTQAKLSRHLSKMFSSGKMKRYGTKWGYSYTL